jgi:hypothetical protein
VPLADVGASDTGSVSATVIGCVSPTVLAAATPTFKVTVLDEFVFSVPLPLSVLASESTGDAVKVDA